MYINPLDFIAIGPGPKTGEYYAGYLRPCSRVFVTLAEPATSWLRRHPLTLRNSTGTYASHPGRYAESGRDAQCVGCQWRITSQPKADSRDPSHEQ